MPSLVPMSEFEKVEAERDTLRGRVAELEQENADLQQQIPKWIKCSEQMPEKHTPVLIYAKSTWGNEIMCVAQWSYLSENYPVYWDCVGASGYERENDFENEDVTLWMPLPFTQPSDHKADLPLPDRLRVVAASMLALGEEMSKYCCPEIRIHGAEIKGASRIISGTWAPGIEEDIPPTPEKE